MPAVPKVAPDVQQQSGFGAFFKPTDTDLNPPRSPHFFCPARRYWYPDGEAPRGTEPCGEDNKGGGCTDLVQDVEGGPGQWGFAGGWSPGPRYPNHWIASAPRY